MDPNVIQPATILWSSEQVILIGSCPSVDFVQLRLGRVFHFGFIFTEIDEDQCVIRHADVCYISLTSQSSLRSTKRSLVRCANELPESALLLEFFLLNLGNALEVRSLVAV